MSSPFNYGPHLFPDDRWPLDEYLDLVEAWPWSFAALPDYCVEPQVATDAAIRRIRIDATVTMARRAQERAALRRISTPLLPVLQGWFADEYVYCAERMFYRDWAKACGARLGVSASPARP